jgi:hypothetical protein
MDKWHAGVMFTLAVIAATLLLLAVMKNWRATFQGAVMFGVIWCVIGLVGPDPDGLFTVIGCCGMFPVAIIFARWATEAVVFLADYRRLAQARAREARWQAAVEEAACRQAREWRPHYP